MMKKWMPTLMCTSAAEWTGRIAFVLHTTLGLRVPDLEFDQTNMPSHLLMTFHF